MKNSKIDWFQYLHGDIFRNNCSGWIGTRFITFGGTKLGPALSLSNGFGYLPLLYLVVAYHFKLPVVIIEPIFCDYLETIFVFLSIWG